VKKFASSLSMIVLAATSLTAGSAQAKIPLFNYTCPGNLEVHADQGGPVYINGKETKLKKVNNNFYEATGSNVTLSISINPDESVTVSYTGPKGVNGICSEASASKPQPSASNGTAKAKQSCLAAVAKQTGVAASKLKATDVLSSEAGIGVTVKVPGAQAPWSCTSDSKGKVQGVMYTGSEGKL
jgi:hypothetical protein